MATEVILPKVDMDMETGQISRWFVKEGDTVSKGQLLFEIETDKAAMEVDSPASGILANISAAEGAVVPVGQAVAWIYTEGEDRTAQSAATAEEPAPASAPVAEAAPAVTAAPAASQHPVVAAGNELRATPLARRLAREAGIDLATVQGSGPKGRVQKKDLEGLAAHQPAQKAAASNKPSAPATASGSDLLHAVWLREGDAGKLPVVLVHGFASDLNSWRGLFAGASLGHPILAVDLPGHGQSPRIVPDSIDAMAGMVEATLASLGVTACVLVGHSLGGAVATAIAARNVVDIRSLLLISSGGLGPQVNGAFINGIIAARSEASLLPWLHQLVADPALISKPFVTASLAQAQDSELRAAQTGIANRFFADSTQTFATRSLLASLAMPVRLIFGSEDRVIPVAQSHGLPGQIGLHIFAQCGHMPQLEQREAVFKILAECTRAAS